MSSSNTAVKGQMKGLLKGLRYISQIFDEEDEKEIQIGFPTDVKHLAHIGCDDAKANAPSWMTEFKETSEQQPAPDGAVNSTKSVEENNGKVEGKRSHVRRSRQRSTDSQSSPPRENSTEGSKPSRRHHSSEASKKTHRQSTEEEKPPPSSSSSSAATSTSTSTSKHSHRRKSKTSEEKDGSTRRGSRHRRTSKGESMTDFSFTDSGPGPTSQ